MSRKIVPDQSVAIMGCGWLGLSLARHLISRNFTVKGSVTSTEKLPLLRNEGIQPFSIHLGNHQDNFPVDFLHANCLVIAIPASSLHGYTAGLIDLISLSPVEHIIYIGSTAVYPNLNRRVDETDAAHKISPHSGIDLLSLEESFLNLKPLTIVRFAGLYGPNRHPGRFLSGKTALSNGSAPVNLIHRDDCIHILQQIIEENVHGHILNACSDAHPTRKEFYTLAATALGLEPPDFREADVPSFKIVSNDRLKTVLGYSFRHPDPMADL